MSDFRVAHRYARSLIELAETQGNLEAVHSDMEAFLKVCGENRDFLLMLRNPIIKHDKKRAVIRALFGGKVTELTSSFFDIICRKRREKSLQAVAVEFHNQYNFFKGIAAASVITAAPLTDDTRKEFTEILKSISGKSKIELVETIDKDLIGGFILKIGDRQIDDSVSGKLRTLRKQMHVAI